MSGSQLSANISVLLEDMAVSSSALYKQICRDAMKGSANRQESIVTLLEHYQPVEEPDLTHDQVIENLFKSVAEIYDDEQYKASLATVMTKFLLFINPTRHEGNTFFQSDLVGSLRKAMSTHFVAPSVDRSSIIQSIKDDVLPEYLHKRDQAGKVLSS